ncbi:MAG: acyl-protein synthetase [Lachnospiraceae bacterium]
MDYDEILQRNPYEALHREKSKVYGQYLTELTGYHREHCKPYERFLRTLGYQENVLFSEEEIPMVPIAAFKNMDLCSVPKEEIFKIVTSSGTAAGGISKIYLDAKTAANQQKTLNKIVSDYIGERRIPLLIIDTKKVLKDRTMFSARGAGILGFSIFASEKMYGLNEEMELDVAGIQSFLARHKGEPILVFGFTYLIWSYFYKALAEQGKTLEIPNGIMIHGGGWKKLEHEAVLPREFNEKIGAVSGIKTISNYYGMAEQTGCIYMECPYGHLHASFFSDVITRRADDFSPCAFGEKGILQVLSLLPESYPGHSILTEDEGIILGEDDCPCGRKGKYFRITSRIPQAQVRGCSDTYEG